MSEKKDSPLTGMASTMNEGMELMRRMWSMTGLPQLPAAGIAPFAQAMPPALPSIITPTLDIGELDKRIADLRAVEQWLELNVTMLRATIQTLEVQRNTIATIKTFGGSMLTTMNDATRAATAASRAAGAPAPAPMAARGSTEPTSTWPPQREATVPERKPGTRRKEQAKAADAAPSLPLHATAWWNALQDQFARVAAAATVPAAAAAPASPARPASATKRRRKAAGS